MELKNFSPFFEKMELKNFSGAKTIKYFAFVFPIGITFLKYI